MNSRPISMRRYHLFCSSRQAIQARLSSLRITLSCRSIIFLFPLFLLVPAHATDKAAAVAVSFSVTDDRHQPVSEATIEISVDGAVLANIATDSAGNRTVKLSKAGQYVFTVNKSGYVTSESRLDIDAESGAKSVEVVLTQIALSKQNVTVYAKPADVVTAESGTQTTLSIEQVKQTPSKPATLTDALPLIPGVVRQGDGSLSIAGYAENHSTLLVNSVDVTDPSTGGFGLSVPIDSVETISVSEMPYLAQYGSFIAGVVAAETRRGGDKWNFSLNDPLPEFRIRSGHLVGLKNASPRVNFGGPLIANRLFFSEGSEYLLYKQAVRTLPFPVNETKSRAINSFSQVDGIISPTQMFTATLHLAPRSVKYAGLGFFNPQPVTPNTDIQSYTGTLLHRIAMRGGVSQNTVAITDVTSGIQPQGKENMVLTPMGNEGNYFGQQSRRARRLQWIENWSPRALKFGGEHRLEIGSVLGYSEDEGQLHARTVQIQDATQHLLQRIDFTPGKEFAVAEYTPAAYLQDHWIANSQLAMDMGIRVEAQTITHTTRFAPRAGFVWAPARLGGIVIRGGTGIFYDYVPLGTFAFSSYPEQVITTYGPSGVVIDGSVRYVNTTQQRTNSHFPFVDRGQTSGNFAPYSIAWNVEADRPVNRWLTLRLKYLQSWAEDLITLQPAVVQGQHALVLGSGGTARTRQLEFTARIGPQSWRQFFFSYVRQYAFGDLANGAGYTGDFPFPVVRENLRASLPTEVPNRFLLWGVYALPLKLQLSPLIEYRNGFPFQPTDVLQRYIASTSGSQHRLPRYLSLDMRVSKDFKVTQKYAVRFSVSMLNLTNHFNALDVHSNVADPVYGTFFGNYQRRFLADFDVLF